MTCCLPALVPYTGKQVYLPPCIHKKVYSDRRDLRLPSTRSTVALLNLREPRIKELSSKSVSSCLHAHTVSLQLRAKFGACNPSSLHYLTKGHHPCYIINIVHVEPNVNPYFKLFSIYLNNFLIVLQIG